MIARGVLGSVTFTNRRGPHAPTWGLEPVQLRLVTAQTGDAYVTEGGWAKASLSQCPLHPQGGCGFARHGSYSRKHPPGTRIARYYCRSARVTWSLLPDFLASGLPSTVDEIEAVAVRVEAAPSVEAAAETLRPDVTLASAVRWVRRRLNAVRTFLRVLVTLSPMLVGCAPTAIAVRKVIGSATLRSIAVEQLAAIARPLGLGPRCRSP